MNIHINRNPGLAIVTALLIAVTWIGTAAICRPPGQSGTNLVYPMADHKPDNTVFHDAEKETFDDILPYQNSKLPVDERVADLLGRMSLEEKVAQLQSHHILLFNSISDLPAIGGLGYARVGNPDSPADDTEFLNACQRIVMQKSRLGIPALIHTEAIHGVANKTATIFPVSVALAGTFDVDLMERVANVIGKESRVRGLTHVLSPTLDLARDVRWGRVQETYGEDTYLSTLMATAFCKSIEGQGVVTTPKAFAVNHGYAGRDSWSIEMDEHMLREVYFPAFKSCFQKAGARSVMVAYNSLNGLPCTMNEWLLTKVLRDEWGFTGFVVSDYYSINWLIDFHKMTDNRIDAASMALNAGMDVELPEINFYGTPLLEAIKSNKVSIETLDKSVSRVLRVKFEKGLFENPFGDPKEANRICASDEHREIALESALKSMTLLKNRDEILPLDNRYNKIAILGRTAQHPGMGDYSGWGVPIVNLLEGLKNHASKGVEFIYDQVYEPQRGFLHVIPKENFVTVADGKEVNGLTMELFNNLNFTGEPTATYRVDEVYCEGRTRVASGIELPVDVLTNPEGFSIMWKGQFISPVSANLRMNLRSCDVCPVRLFVDNKLVHEFFDGEKRHDNQAFNLEAIKGQRYDIRLEYASTHNRMLRASLEMDYPPDYSQAIQKAMERIHYADVIIVTTNSGDKEGQDRARLELPYPQPEIIKAAVATGKPVIVLLTNGSAVTMEGWGHDVDAILETWYAGMEGGNAIAQVLYGKYNPAGRLPVSFPEYVGQCPLYYNFKPSGRRYDYKDMSGDPLYPFGHGLSFTSFEYNNLTFEKKEVEKGEPVKITLSVTNTGKVIGDEVVQLYLHDKLASVVRPLKELKGFSRINIEPGETKTVEFTLTGEELGIWDRNMNFVVETGKFEVMIGASSRDIRLSDIFIVK
jgi:beta-glucosidase